MERLAPKVRFCYEIFIKSKNILTQDHLEKPRLWDKKDLLVFKGHKGQMVLLGSPDRMASLDGMELWDLQGHRAKLVRKVYIFSF